MTGRVLVVTGANGFVGTHLAALARAEGTRVWGVGRERQPTAALAPHCERYLAADLENEWPTRERADAVVHLAGLAAVGPSFDEPQRYITVNTTIMTTIGEALLRHSHRPRLVVVSSGAVYAPPSDQTPISEISRLAPTSPYAVAKLAVETQSDYYRLRGLDTVVARPFNHIGPGQSRGFLVPDMTAALDDAPAGEPIRVGNLAAARDYTDVRDVARAYLTLAFAPTHRHEVYNVASGTPRSGYEVVEAIAAALGKPVPPLEPDPARFRPNDPPRIVGSAARLTDEYGWSPSVGWDRSIAEFVADRARTGAT